MTERSRADYFSHRRFYQLAAYILINFLFITMTSFPVASELRPVVAISN
ncbi:hypothetical protein [Microseira sp. BLCC-F43]